MENGAAVGLEPKGRPSSPLVFISHDSRDEELAASFSRLLHRVSSGMLKSFYSSDKKGKQGIEFGAEWYQSLMKKLCSASDIVCLLTERSLGRPWILYEAGFAKGKWDAPIIGIALGIPLSKASTGPFGQFKNCGDDVESLTTLIMQLAKRIPGLEPDTGIVKTQVQAFKNEADVVIKKLAGVGGPEQKDESQKVAFRSNTGSVSSGLSEVALAILDLYHQKDSITLFDETHIYPALHFTKIQTESGIDDLVNAHMITLSRNAFDFSGPEPAEGSAYSLTVQGKKYLAQNM